MARWRREDQVVAVDTNQPAGYYFLVGRSRADQDNSHSNPDHVVMDVFADIQVGLEEHWQCPAEWDAGFLCPCDAASATPGPEVSHAVVAAEVLVQFCSPEYFDDAVAMATRDAFQARFNGAPAELVEPHTLAVVWDARLCATTRPEVEPALAWAPDRAKYAESGLAGLKRRPDRQRTYRELIDRLCRHVVDVAQASPLRRWPGSTMAQRSRNASPPLVVAVLAPTVSELPRSRVSSSSLYGPQASQWRPFGLAQPMPAARHVAGRSRSLDPAIVCDFDPGDRPFAVNPGILLIDPWLLDTDGGEAAVEAALAELPEWTVALVAADRHDPQYDERGGFLCEQALGMLRATRRWRSVRRQLAMRDLAQFDAELSEWISWTYLKFRQRPGPPRPRGGNPPRPRIM